MDASWSEQLRRGESVQIEFKRRCPKLNRLARTFSAFSNSSGGTLFFGVDDNGEIVGLEHLSGTLELVEQVSQFYCNPPIAVTKEVWEPLKGIEVLVVTVPEAEDKPIHALDPNHPKDSWPYFRSDKENLPLDKKSLKTMTRALSVPVPDDVDQLDKSERRIMDTLSLHPRQTLGQIAKGLNISTNRAKKIMVGLERRGWLHAYFNEKRREYSLAIEWRRK